MSDDDGGAPTPENIGDDGGDQLFSGAVEAGVGLVEEQQSRLYEEETSQIDATLHSLGGLVGPPISRGTQANAVEKLIHPARSTAEEPAIERQVLPESQLLVQGWLMGQQPDLGPDGLGAGRAEMGIEHRPGAGIERQQGGAYPQQRRLACTVGSLDAQHLALGELE